MQHQTVPQTSGIIATIRALLAAGWRNDSVYQAGGNTCREMLHPSGREITARTNVYGDDTSLTMTGLTLDQVAGAINGAGLAPANHAAGPAEPDPRRVAYEIATSGVAAGLPIPAAIEIPGHYDMFIVKLPNNDQAGVDAWAKHLALPEAQLGSPLKGMDKEVRDYRSEAHRFPALPGWTVYVRCFVEDAKLAEGGETR